LIDAGSNDERIDNGFDLVFFVFIQFDVVAKVLGLPVDSRPPIAVDANLFEQVLVVFAIDLIDRRTDLYLRALWQRQNAPSSGAGTDRYRFPAKRTVRRAHGREKHPQIVRDVVIVPTVERGLN
jgi:hypothetical protein